MMTDCKRCGCNAVRKLADGGKRCGQCGFTSVVKQGRTVSGHDPETDTIVSGTMADDGHVRIDGIIYGGEAR